MKRSKLLAAPVALWALTGLSPPEPPVAAPDPLVQSAEVPAEAPPPPPPGPAPEPALRPAVGGELFYSSDSDGTEVARAAVDFDLRNAGPGRYLGVSVEQARYNPSGRGWESRERGFVRAADDRGAWQWKARVGTDGDTIIGSVSVNDRSRFRKELFAERDIVETRMGLDRGLYSTFAGAAIDLPLNDRNVVTALAGVQEFTGKNVRLHLRGSYIHVLSPKLGLSAQLRGRYFHSSQPGEFDYYSPRYYAEALPVVQMRRFVSGWELVGAAGLGVQRDSGSKWHESRFAQARFRSPERSRWSVNGGLTYTNTPSLSGASRSGYSYVQLSLGLSRRF